MQFHRGSSTGAGTLTFTTGGTERLRITSVGNVGINVSDPDSNLEINKGSEGRYLKIGGDDASNGRALTFTSSTGGTGSNGALHTISATSGNGAIALDTTGTERLRIHSPGYITKPYQVAFFAHCSIGNHDLDIGDKFQFNTIPSSGYVAVNSNHTTFGGTNVFNTSTNTFTAPVAGLYSFTVTGYYRRTGDPLGPLVPRVNNNEVSNGNNGVFFFANSSPTDGDTMSGTLILQLAVGDEVTVHRRNHGTGTLRFYGPHSHFCGHLIG